MKPHRIIAHLDMDAFYASVELLRYPELRGLPVVIGGGSRHQPVWESDAHTGVPRRRFARLRDYAGRGVVTTATYEARALGVNSAMPTMQAAQLAPEAVLLPPDFDEYRRCSRLFKAAVRERVPLVEDRGIDEIYIDLTDAVSARVEGGLQPTDPAPQEADYWWCAREIGTELKRAVRDTTGLSCSVGLAPNKLLAKLGSELDKPDGLTVITPGDVEPRIWPLSVRRLHGVGPKAAARLAGLGIQRIGDLTRADASVLRACFGPGYTAWLRAAARGIDDRPVVTRSEPKSISRETTFERDLHAVRDRNLLGEIFTDLCRRLAADLQRKGCVSRTLGIKLRFDDFRTVTRDLTLPLATDDADTIRRAAGLCLKRVPLTRRIRLLGVRAGNLQKRA